MTDKINNVEAGVVVTFVALAELLEMALVFIPIIGWIASFFVNICMWLVVQLWLLWKGARGGYYATAGLIELIPILNALPTKTAMLILTIVMHNSPTLQKTISGRKIVKAKVVPPRHSER